MSIERIMDANTNRVAEGLRILEDHARFVMNSELLAQNIRDMKHEVRKVTADCSFINHRDAEGDIGLEISQGDTAKRDRKSLQELVTANFCRVQEGLRSLEEHAKVIGQVDWSKHYEAMRFDAYQVEKAFSRRFRLVDCLATKVYGITWPDDSRGGHLKSVEKMLKGGIRIIQYREKDLRAHRYEELREIRRLTREYGALFIVNDDVELALLVEADGVHLGQGDIDWERLQLIKERLLVGISTHNVSEAVIAEAKGADYIGFGPVFKTGSKQDALEPRSMEILEMVVSGVQLPIVAIGGVTPTNARTLPFERITAFAMIGAIKEADDMEMWMQLWK